MGKGEGLTFLFLPSQLCSLGHGVSEKHACHVLLAVFAIVLEVCKKQEIVACVIPCDPVVLLSMFFSIKLYSRIA